jgi:transposase
MCPAIDNPTSCKIIAVICFLHKKNTSAAEIHCELCVVVYDQNVMSKETVRHWCRMFKDGQTNVHDEERSGQPSVVNDDLVQNFDQKLCERQSFTMYERLCEFPQISSTVLYEFTTVRPGYHQFYARWVLKMLTRAPSTS